MNTYYLKVGSLIEYGREPAQFGVIKWIGGLPNKTDVYAGLEMVRNKLTTTYDVKMIDGTSV